MPETFVVRLEQIDKEWHWRVYRDHHLLAHGKSYQQAIALQLAGRGLTTGPTAMLITEIPGETDG